jgi:hypothetical protein
MVRKKQLILNFATVGFFNGILVSALILFLEWRGREAGVLALIGWVLYPANLIMPEFLESGKAREVLYLLEGSVVNGCLYAAIGLVVGYALETSRRSRQNMKK